jgi:phenylacetate-CoA ligase/benzoylacetate-CoA ligase
MGLDARYWDRDFETRPWPWIESWQAQQVAKMLESLPQRSELYRDVLSPAGSRVGLRGYWVSRGRLPSLEMLEHVPFTTKGQLRRAQACSPQGRPLGLQQAVPQEYVVQVVASAGTTGPPVFSGLTWRDRKTWCEAIACGFWTAGVRPDDVLAHLGGRPAAVDGWPYADGLRRLGSAVAWLDGYQPEQALAQMRQLQASALITTTAFALHVDGRELGLRKLLAGGEPGLGQPEVRGQVAEGWGVTSSREVMGLAEVMPAMWSECEDASGMHFNAAKHVLVELVEPGSGARLPWDEGTRGEAVYTTFDRDATPVLRYRSGDELEVTGTRCACGRTSPKARRLSRLAEADLLPPPTEPV